MNHVSSVYRTARGLTARPRQEPSKDAIVGMKRRNLWKSSIVTVNQAMGLANRTHLKHKSTDIPPGACPVSCEGDKQYNLRGQAGAKAERAEKARED